ncbi:MAG: hypothetical protein IMW93_08920 [Thermoanaerobacteraceae bacterium]|nr:hypothetical protein [Thermoanaerobacteraceae bacterium]
MGATGLTAVHWLFLFWVLVIIVVMAMRKDPIIPCILGILTVGWLFKKSFIGAVSTVFSALIVAGNEFWGIIVIISLIVALSRLLSETGADYLIMSPAARLMVSPGVAFWVLGFSMLLASWFFWPSPATALIGAIMLPVAVRAGLPVMAGAMAMNLFGHGIGLSTDYVIQGAPTITAKAAGFTSPTPVMSASLPLIIVMGLVTTVTAYIMIRRDMARNHQAHAVEREAFLASNGQKQEMNWVSFFLAVITPLAFALDVVAMLVFKLRGGDATALLGGTAALILALGSYMRFGNEGLEKVTDYLREGFMFGIKVFAPVLVIGGFFFMGKGELAQVILGKGATGLLEDMGLALSQAVPVNKMFAALVTMATGIVVGMDGSGFSPLPLVGSVAGTFALAIPGINKATLAALGQLAGVWTGGGTIIPWGLIPVAAIAGVNPIDLARRNFLPVVAGFIATFLVALVLL